MTTRQIDDAGSKTKGNLAGDAGAVGGSICASPGAASCRRKVRQHDTRPLYTKTLLGHIWSEERVPWAAAIEIKVTKKGRAKQIRAVIEMNDLRELRRVMSTRFQDGWSNS